MKINEKLKSLGMLLLGIFGFSGVYLPINYINSTRTDHFHAYTNWELAIPLLPWMILFYFSVYLMPLLPLFKTKYEELKVLAQTTVLSSCIGGIIFIGFPTVLGWERNIEEVGMWAPLFEFLWKADYPYNLAPSQHVVMAHLLIIPVIPKLKSKVAKGFCYFMFAAISSSILFVHQHHLLDLVTGFMLADLCYRYFYKPKVEALNGSDSIVIPLRQETEEDKEDLAA